MVSMYMQECLQMQVAMHYMQAKFLQVALMFVLQVQAGCCSLDYIKTVAVVYTMRAHVLERLYDIYVGIHFGFCDSFPCTEKFTSCRFYTKPFQSHGND